MKQSGRAGGRAEHERHCAEAQGPRCAPLPSAASSRTAPAVPSMVMLRWTTVLPLGLAGPKAKVRGVQSGPPHAAADPTPQQKVRLNGEADGAAAATPRVAAARARWTTESMLACGCHGTWRRTVATHCAAKSGMKRSRCVVERPLPCPAAFAINAWRPETPSGRRCRCGGHGHPPPGSHEND